MKFCWSVSLSRKDSGSKSMSRASNCAARLSSVVVPDSTQIVVPPMSSSVWYALSPWTIIP